MSTSERLSLPYLLPSQAQKHVTHNEALQRLDILVQLAVTSFEATTPPSLPEDGEVHALGAAPTGAWAGHADELAAWADGSWYFIAPQEGWQAIDKTAGVLQIRTASGWEPAALPDLNNLAGAGINASYDVTNRLSVSAPATLLNHEGAGHQLKLNKSGATDTASLLFQTDWSGRAEMGTAGTDAFTIKVSADGSAWTTALGFDGASGIASGAAVQQDSEDTTAGRLARADYAFSPGNLLAPVTQSGGVPTGGVIERGSNSNGEYVRFADGTQICMHLMQVGYTTSGVCSGNWVFPMAFSAAPHGLSVQLESTGTATPTEQELAPTRAQGATLTSVDLRQPRISGLTNFVPGDFVDIYAIAIGRWF